MLSKHFLLLNLAPFKGSSAHPSFAERCKKQSLFSDVYMAARPASQSLTEGSVCLIGEELRVKYDKPLV